MSNEAAGPVTCGSTLKRISVLNLRVFCRIPLLPFAEITSNVQLTLTFDPPNRHP
jgi:hypothetical protein